MQRRRPLGRVASLSEPPSAIRAVAGAGSEGEEPAAAAASGAAAESGGVHTKSGLHWQARGPGRSDSVGVTASDRLPEEPCSRAHKHGSSLESRRGVLGPRAAHWTLPVGLVGPGPEDLPALHVARGWAVASGGCSPASGLLVGGGWRLIFRVDFQRIGSPAVQHGAFREPGCPDHTGPMLRQLAHTQPRACGANGHWPLLTRRAPA
jgi:hypothetical protein